MPVYKCSSQWKDAYDKCMKIKRHLHVEQRKCCRACCRYKNPKFPSIQRREGKANGQLEPSHTGVKFCDSVWFFFEFVRSERMHNAHRMRLVEGNSGTLARVAHFSYVPPFCASSLAARQFAPVLKVRIR